MEGDYIYVDELNQTSNSNIFAVGDIINKPNLTPVAIEPVSYTHLTLPTKSGV